VRAVAAGGYHTVGVTAVRGRRGEVKADWTKEIEASAEISTAFHDCE
jgi:hypothetical protein